VNAQSFSAVTTTAYKLALTALLAFGGTLVMHWIHTLILGHTDLYEPWGGSEWLRDSILALPFVAGAVFLAGRRAQPASTAHGMSVASLFGVVMSAGALLGQVAPSAGHVAAHGEIATLPLLRETAVVTTAAGVYALALLWLLNALAYLINNGFERLPTTRPWHRVALVPAVALAVVPAVLLTDQKEAAAQTTFPDHAIHPTGTLTLVARVLSDGSFGYVAVGYGALGIRPIIEMNEGETLNITLKNEMHKDVSLHVHGVYYGQESDGTRMSKSFVPPGGQRTYQWRALAGSAGYWHYHDHVMGDDEGTVGILNGLYGGLVVRRAGDPKPAKSFLLVFHDLTINGSVYPRTPTLTARQGELVEFIVVSYMDRLHTFHLHGHRWLTPSRPGNPSPTAAANVGSGREDNHILAPGDSFGFLATAGENVGPGMWMYHCHVQSHSGMMMGYFQVLPPQAK
jgi:FtsP/CotA-like multicopper oxidase with cupredoxin domain